MAEAVWGRIDLHRLAIDGSAPVGRLARRHATPLGGLTWGVYAVFLQEILPHDDSSLGSCASAKDRSHNGFAVRLPTS